MIIGVAIIVKLFFPLVNLLKSPCTQDVQPSDISVDENERWSSLEKELICVGFCSGLVKLLLMLKLTLA